MTDQARDFNLDEPTNRSGTASLKWTDAGQGELPMWVADMDLRTAPVVRHALAAVAREGILGYQVVTDEYVQAITTWWQRRYGWRIAPSWMIPSVGAIPSMSSIVRSVTNVFEKVVLLEPVYNGLFTCVLNQGRRIQAVDLLQNAAGTWQIDWQALEEALADPLATLMILCNPHNPAGRVWSRDELARIGELAAAHGLLVLSDEVHCDLTLPGVTYTPFASASAVCESVSITCVSPSKSFNVAGVHSACVIVPDDHVRARVSRSMNSDEVAEPGVFAVPVVAAAYSAEGEAWLEAVRGYVCQAKVMLRDALAEASGRTCGATAPVSEATYLAWVDVRGLIAERGGLGTFPGWAGPWKAGSPARSAGEVTLPGGGEAAASAIPPAGWCGPAGPGASRDHAGQLPPAWAAACALTEELAAWIRSETGLWLTPGTEYGASGAGFLRINLATQHSRVADGAARLVRSLTSWWAG